MDVISHLAFGRVLVAFTHCRPTPATPSSTPTPRRTFRTRPLTAALIVGAIAPDADAILMPFGWDHYLIWHERGTHTLFGAMAMAALLATLLRFVIQPLLKRPPTPWRMLWFAAIVGCLSHLLLDAICGGSLHPLWPLLDARLSMSLVAMADPLLAVPLLLFLIATFIWRRPRPAFVLAIAVTIAMTIVIGAKIISRQRALRAYHQQVAPETNAIRTIEARWGSLTQWYVYDRVDSRVRAWLVDAATGHATLYTERRTTPTTEASRALVNAATQLDTVRRAQSLFDFTFPELLRHDDGSIDVLWSDIRFCRVTECDLRFGGRFDPSGRAIEQVVLIGTVRQTRQP